MRSTIRILFGVLTATVAGLVALYFWVNMQTKDSISNQLEDLPKYRVGLLLGTSAYTTDGSSNPFYANRILAASQAYFNGTIEKILVSGDNKELSYNEPRKMYQDLVKAGVDPEDIAMDFAGFRTFDSVVRAKKVFGLDSCLIISQSFHLARAITIANWNGMTTHGYEAINPPTSFGMKVYMREFFARAKMVLDLLFGQEPYHLGEQELI